MVQKHKTENVRVSPVTKLRLKNMAGKLSTVSKMVKLGELADRLLTVALNREERRGKP
jgi:hypothetical protein